MLPINSEHYSLCRPCYLLPGNKCNAINSILTSAVIDMQHCLLYICTATITTTDTTTHSPHTTIKHHSPNSGTASTTHFCTTSTSHTHTTSTTHFHTTSTIHHTASITHTLHTASTAHTPTPQAPPSTQQAPPSTPQASPTPPHCKHH